MAGKQAEQTAKQANVLLLFTVVTAVFVCPPAILLGCPYTDASSFLYPS